MKEKLLANEWKYYQFDCYRKNDEEVYTFGEITNDCGHKIPRFRYYPSQNKIYVNDGGNMGGGWSFKVYTYEDIQKVIGVVEKK
jgi:hypothetical protein